MGVRGRGQPNISRRKKKVGGTDRPQAQRRGAEGSNEISGTVNWDVRYGDLREYRRQCAIAHKAVKGLCCVCLINDSEELHHAKYGNDVIGESVFPVCSSCHDLMCHSSKNWLKDKKNPVWRNRNTSEFIERLKIGYKLLYKGIEK